MAGRLDGLSLRVPVPDGSITDLVATVRATPTVDDIREAYELAAEIGRLAGLLEYSEDDLVSTDIVGSPASWIFDSKLTMASGNMVKVRRRAGQPQLAHQWFGDLVTCRDWGEGWLNEGFATYAEYLWREHHEGRDAADLELEEWAEGISARTPAATAGHRDQALRRADSTSSTTISHEKGGRVLHMLRALLGDDAFGRALAHHPPSRSPNP